MKTVIITQARMNSSRLPGKVLRTVLGKTLLAYHVERLKRVPNAQEIVIATTDTAADDSLMAAGASLRVCLFRGSENDVLSRFAGAAEASQADVVVRVTADCPLIDPQVIAKTIQFYLDHSQEVDYVSNIQQRTYPRGMDTEVFSRQLLDEAASRAKAPFEREHVTPFIIHRPDVYRLANVSHSTDESRHRLTVDTEEDFALIQRLIEGLVPTKPQFSLDDVLSLLREHPEWSALNEHVQQRPIGETV
jgi:spore coat polysaccharide biosynthesis protein SpsF